MSKKMTWLDAAYQVLKEENRPLHSEELANLIYERSYYPKTRNLKEAGIHLHAVISSNMNSYPTSCFCQPAPSTFKLVPNPTLRKTPPKSNVSKLPAIIIQTLQALKVPSSIDAIAKYILDNKCYDFATDTPQQSINTAAGRMCNTNKEVPLIQRKKESEKGKYLYFLKK